MRFHIISGKYALALGEPVDLTEEGFRKIIVHDRRGTSGTKAHEAPHKDGPAIVPAIGLPTAPRRKTSLLTASAMILLDLDDQDKEEILFTCSRMDKDGVGYVLWSTYSYGAAHKGDLLPCRLAVFTDREYPVDIVPAVRQRFADRYGLLPDTQCLQHAALFYAPACPIDREPFVRHGYGQPVNPYRYVTDRDQEKARIIALRTAARADVGPASPAYCKAAEEGLARLEGAIANNPNEHARKTLNGCWYYARYEAAGALPPGSVQERFERAIQARVALRGEDDFSRRAEHVADQITRGLREPELPDLPDSAADEASYAHQAATVRPTVTLQEGERIQRELLARPRTRPLVLMTTPGGGKTRAALAHIADTKLMSPAVLASASHELLGEMATRLAAEHSVYARHHRGVTARIPGQPVCKKLPVVNAVAAAGLSPARNVCKTCQFRGDCKARNDIIGEDEAVHLAPWNMAPQLLKDRDLTLYVDEEPALSETLTAPLATPLDFTYLNRASFSALEKVLAARRTGAAPAAVLLVSAGASPFTQDDDAGLGRLLRDGVDPDVAFTHEPTKATLAVLRAVQESIRHPFSISKGEITVTKESELVNYVITNNGVLLSATPDEDFWAAKGAEIARVDIEDAVTVTRTWLYRSSATRGVVLPKGEPKWSEILPAVENAIGWAIEKGVKRLLICTYKDIPLAEQKIEWQCEVDFCHYGNTVGLDKWKDFDGFASMFDHRPGGKGYETSTAFASRELAQFHGRARAPSRSTSCHHLHQGRVIPLGWHKENSDFVRSRTGRPRRTP